MRGDDAEGAGNHRIDLAGALSRHPRHRGSRAGSSPNVCLELGIADTIGRRTRLLGEQGTERRLKEALPGVAKRRCLSYSNDPSSSQQLTAGLQSSLAGGRRWARAGWWTDSTPH